MKIKSHIKAGTHFSKSNGMNGFRFGGYATNFAGKLPSLNLPPLDPTYYTEQIKIWFSKLIQAFKNHFKQIQQANKEQIDKINGHTFRTLTALKTEWLYIQRYWKPYRWQGALIVSSLLAYKSLHLLVASALKTIVDGVTVVQGTASVFPTLGLALVVGFPIVLFLNLISEKVIARVSSNMANDIRADLFRHIQTLSSTFFKQAQPGDISSRFSSDTNVILDAIGKRYIFALASSLGALITIPVLFYLNFRLAIFVLLVLPATIAVLIYLTPYLIESTYRFKESEGVIGNLVQENIYIQPIVKSFGATEVMTQQFVTRLEQLADDRFDSIYQLGLLRVSATQFLFMMEIIATVAGGAMVFTQTITAGSLVAFLLMLDITLHDLSDVVKWNIPYIAYASGAVHRLEDILQEEPMVVDAPTAYTLPAFQEYIQFEHVSFSYNEEQTHLHDINLMIEAGQHIAIVGANGAGKSTLLNLLMRFYDVSTGQITIDGHDIRHVTQSSLRQQMSIVFQQPFLFDATIMDNIRVSQPNASEAHVIQVAKQAHIHEFIMTLPTGYQTRIGKQGDTLSGGQKQKIAIARSLLRDPAILILDEVTSGLDAETKLAVQDIIAGNIAGRTVITITHDLTSVYNNVDQIFVLDAGNLIEQGTHSQLVRKKGIYCRLWKEQNK